MFLRKLLGSSDAKVEEKKGTTPPGMQTMGANLQRKFAKGVQYNMKLIVKGDRNVGKSCLFSRLQGQKFREEYIPTEEIQVASIQWNYKATDDVVKVEVWDVVDKGKKKKKLDGLKLDNGQGLAEDPCLDAEFIDVYKGTHGVIMMMDITKQWTFDYVQREIPKIPPQIPVLVLANHRDMGHHRTVMEDTVRYFIEDLNRGEDGGKVRYAEASMRNGFGLKYIHKFFNLPFLQLQRETLLRQLETNKKEMQTVIDELDIHEESEDQNYDMFLEGLTAKRRQAQEKLAEKALAEAKAKQEEEARVAAEAATAATAGGAGHTTNGPTSSVSAPTTPAATPTGIREAPPARPIPGLQMSAPPPSTATMTSSVSAPNVTVAPSGGSGGQDGSGGGGEPPGGGGAEKGGGFMSRWFGRKDKDKEKGEPLDVMAAAMASGQHMGSIDDFAPEEGLDASFLEDTKDVKGFGGPSAGGLETSDSEGEGGNPLVAGFQDELDSEDEAVLANTKSVVTTSSSAVPTAAAAVALDEDDLSSEDGDNNNVPVIAQDVDLDSDEDSLSSPAFRPQPPMLQPMRTAAKQKRAVESPKKQSTVYSNQTSKQTVSHSSPQRLSLESDIDARNSNVVSKHREHSDDDEDEDKGEEDEEEKEEENSNQAVTILQDEDLSDGEDQSAASSKPTDSGLATDTTQDNDGSQGSSDIKPSALGLDFEDLSVLETGLDSSTGQPRITGMSPVGSDLTLSSGRPDTDTDLDSSNSSKKKKKHKSKEKERNKDKDGEKSSKKSKHKKHSEKDKHRETEVDIDSKDKKKKRSKKKGASTGTAEELPKQEMDELEAFLGGGGPEMASPPGDDYESL